MIDIWEEPLPIARGIDLNENKYMSLYESCSESFKKSLGIEYFADALDLCRAAIAIYACQKKHTLINRVISNFCSDFSPYKLSNYFTTSKLYCIDCDEDMATLRSKINEIKRENVEAQNSRRSRHYIWGKLSGTFLFNENVQKLRDELDSLECSLE